MGYQKQNLTPEKQIFDFLQENILAVEEEIWAVMKERGIERDRCNQALKNLGNTIGRYPVPGVRKITHDLYFSHESPYTISRMAGWSEVVVSREDPKVLLLYDVMEIEKRYETETLGLDIETYPNKENFQRLKPGSEIYNPYFNRRVEAEREVYQPDDTPTTADFIKNYLEEELE